MNVLSSIPSRLSASASVVGLLTLLVLPALFAVACKSDYPASGRQTGSGDKSARQVKTAPVMQTPVGQTVTVNGTLAAYDQTTVSTKVAGRLQSISVDLGSVVRRGQRIPQLETRDL